MDLVFTPKNKFQPHRFERTKRFMRKPAQKSERSTSKKSLDSSVKEMYIKSPTNVNINKEPGKQADFFTALAESMISKIPDTDRNSVTPIRSRQRSSEGYQNDGNDYGRYRAVDQDKTANKNYQTKIRTLQAELQLKNHQLEILSGEHQRVKAHLEDEKEKRRKMENERKQLSKQLRDLTKTNQNLKMEARRYEKQKEHLMKQIQFLQRINYDEKTRNIQSYRQKYLEAQLQKVKNQLLRSKGDKEEDLERHIRIVKEQKFTIESHYKAMKVANECLIKQLNHTQQNIHNIILNSQEYKKLRDKYVRFLEEYKLLRNEYWSLKAESNSKNVGNDSSSLFSITASEVEDDLSLLKNQSSSESLSNLKNVRPQIIKSASQRQRPIGREPTYASHPRG